MTPFKRKSPNLKSHKTGKGIQKEGMQRYIISQNKKNKKKIYGVEQADPCLCKTGGGG